MSALDQAFNSKLVIGSSLSLTQSLATLATQSVIQGPGASVLSPSVVEIRTLALLGPDSESKLESPF